MRLQPQDNESFEPIVTRAPPPPGRFELAWARGATERRGRLESLLVP
jgi:hypothetical protein